MTTDTRPLASASTTAAAATERAKLKRHFGRMDMTFFLIFTLVGVDTIGSIAANGGQAFTWLIALGLLCFPPSALIVAELGSTFPDEGGPYIWPRMAFGHLVGAVNQVLCWITNRRPSPASAWTTSWRRSSRWCCSSCSASCSGPWAPRPAASWPATGSEVSAGG